MSFCIDVVHHKMLYACWNLKMLFRLMKSFTDLEKVLSSCIKRLKSFWHHYLFTFTFMHLADAFIQSDLLCIQVTVFTFYQLLLSLGIEPMILALLAPCSTIWATGKLIVWLYSVPWLFCPLITVISNACEVLWRQERVYRLYRVDITYLLWEQGCWRAGEERLKCLFWPS